jgi:protease-4
VLVYLALGASLLLNVVQFAGSGGAGPGRGVVTTQIVAGDADQQIAVVPLEGEIDAAAADRIDRFLDRVEENPGVKGLVLEIDTPGGTVTASDEIYQRIRRYKQSRKDKGRSDLVVVAMKSMATSGGFYAACAGDYIFAEHTTFTGNIGVLMPSYNVSGLMSRYGVEETTIVSTGATYKNAGSPYRPEQDQDRKYLQGLADSAFTRFKEVVSAGRGTRLTGKIDDLADGKVYVASDAKKAGLIDDIGYPRDAYDYAARTASVKNPSVVRYQDSPPGLASLLPLLSSRGAAAPASAGGAPGINLNIGPETLDRFATPRMLYRWRGQ